MRKNKNFEKHKLYWLAFDHLKKSAYSGNPEGQYDYAQQFDSISFLGVNNPLYNPKKCIYWYTKSATGGYAEAYNNLADFYERGEGIRQDLKMSYESNLEIFEKDINQGKYRL